MTTFDDRENAFENKFAHDAETAFRILARRNRLLGEWAASFLDLDATESEAYAKSVVIADLEEAGDEDVIRKLVADLAPAAYGASRDQNPYLAEVAARLPTGR